MSTDDSNNNPKHIPLDDSIKAANAIIDKLLGDNDFEDAMASCDPYVHNSLYHSLLRTVGLLIMAGSTMEKEDIEKASKSVTKFAKLTNKFRKRGLLISALKIVKTPNYNKYSDLELHAELLHTFYLALSAAVCAMETHNIYGLIKVAYRLQKYILKFKGCRMILKKRNHWDSDTSQQTFEAAVRVANGVKHLAISQVPPKILKLINILGYRGRESTAWEEINKTAYELPGMYSRAARAVLIGYWLYGEPHGNLGPRHLENCKQLIDKEAEPFPNGLIFLGAKAKLMEVSGQIDLAIKMFEEIAKTEYQGVQKATKLELIFCHALKCNWDECIKYAEHLRTGTIHSPTIATYAEAMFRYVKSIDTNDVALKKQASELMETIPSLRIRHLGKTITPEKIAVENSLKYFKCNEFLILPEMDILHQGNWLSLVKGDMGILNPLFQRVEKELNHYKDGILGSDNLDNYLVALFYKGVILRWMGRFDEAKQCFNDVIKYESRIGREYSIPAQAVMELGLTEMDAGNGEVAKKLLQKAIHDHHGYLHENFVHIRAYAGLRELGISTDKDKADESKLEEYKKQWLKEINVEEKSYATIVEKEEEETAETVDK